MDNTNEYINNAISEIRKGQNHLCETIENFLLAQMEKKNVKSFTIRLDHYWNKAHLAVDTKVDKVTIKRNKASISIIMDAQTYRLHDYSPRTLCVLYSECANHLNQIEEKKLQNNLVNPNFIRTFAKSNNNSSRL